MRFSARATTASLFLTLGVASLGGCDDIKGRDQNRKAVRAFHEAQFVDAAAMLEQSLKKIDEPVVHYNLGLAYSKVFKPGFDGPILLGPKGDPVCTDIPGTQLVEAGACVKAGDRHYAECGKAKTSPIEAKIAELNTKLGAATTDDAKRELQAEIKDAQDDLGRYTCASSFQCVEGQFCSLTGPVVADMAATHFQTWIKAQPSDEQIKTDLVGAKKDLVVAKAKFDAYDTYLKAVAALDSEAALTADRIEKEKDPAVKVDLQKRVAQIPGEIAALKDKAPPSFDKSALDPLEKRVDDLLTKDQTRKLMTQLWIDSSQFDKALAYWQGILGERPSDPELMGNLAGINLKAGDWRKSIDWFLKVVDATTDPAGKVESLQFIGNVAWSKLNSKTLGPSDSAELADRGISALQKAAAISPKIPKLWSLQASLYNFRSTAEGASWAAAIDRASAQDLLHVSRVIQDEAKKDQNPQAPAPPPAPAAPSAPPAGATGNPPAAKTGG